MKIILLRINDGDTDNRLDNDIDMSILTLNCYERQLSYL